MKVVGACCGMMKLLRRWAPCRTWVSSGHRLAPLRQSWIARTVLPSCPRRLPGATSTGPRITCSSSGPRRVLGRGTCCVQFPAQDFRGTAGHPRSQEGEAAAQGPEGGQAGPELPEQVGAVRDPLEENPGDMKRARAEASGDCDAEDPGGTPRSRGSQPAGGGARWNPVFPSGSGQGAWHQSRRCTDSPPGPQAVSNHEGGQTEAGAYMVTGGFQRPLLRAFLHFCEFF